MTDMEDVLLTVERKAKVGWARFYAEHSRAERLAWVAEENAAIAEEAMRIAYHEVERLREPCDVCGLYPAYLGGLCPGCSGNWVPAPA